MEVQNDVPICQRFPSEVVWASVEFPTCPNRGKQRSELDEPTGLYWPNGEPILLRDAWRINMQGGC